MDAHGGCKRELDSPELELQVVRSQSKWLLENWTGALWKRNSDSLESSLQS